MQTRSLQAKFILPVSGLIAVTMLLLVAAVSVSRSRSIEQGAQNEIEEKRATVRRMLTITDAIMMERVKGSMKLLMERGQGLGAARQGGEVTVGEKQVPELLLGSQAQANHFELVDAVTATQGGTATLFSKAGEDFVRVSTNVKKDNKRAIGTVLNPQGKAIAAIREGKAFYGQVDILGNPYLTGYEPILDAQNKAIGIWYVGYLIDMQPLKEAIASSHILERGFVALLDDKGKVRFQSDNAGPDLVAAVLKGDPGWEVKRETFGPWGFEMVTAYPREEVSGMVKKEVFAVVAAGVALGVLLVGLLSWLSRTLVIQPLREAVKIAETIAQGDLTSSLRVQRDDEIGTLQKAMASMQDGLRQMIDSVSSSARNIIDLSATMSATAHNVKAHSGEQAAAAIAAAGAVEELTVSIEHVTENAQASLSLTQEAGSTARSGEGIVNRASAEMCSIAESVNQATQRVLVLGEHSVKISSIANVIKEIADQTNLLALNAAIEAARAGEQGRGFAVVADEVRKLAERTGSSTEEITATIAAIRAEIEQAVESMHTGQARASSGMTIAGEAGTAMAEISGGSDRVVHAVNDIFAALREQTTTSGQLAINVQDIATMSEKNAKNIEDVANAADHLRQSANLLQGAVARFRV
ncbi:MAG TPA: Cache 3/Cache 2 fusion domain-containing protein [Rhodocyclaceae bacterium]